MKHVMLDLETLGTTSDAVIMSIGAVKFDLESDRIDDAGFYASVSVESNLDLRRVINESTLMWWLKQEPAAQAVFHEPKQTLEQSLCELSDWFDRDDYEIWANGASFDTPMVEHAFRQIKMDAPWRYNASRCFRTYKALPFAKGVSVPFTGTKHNALHDAIHQARTLQAIHARMKVAA